MTNIAHFDHPFIPDWARTEAQEAAQRCDGVAVTQLTNRLYKKAVEEAGRYLRLYQKDLVWGGEDRRYLVLARRWLDTADAMLDGRPLPDRSLVRRLRAVLEALQ